MTTTEHPSPSVVERLVYDNKELGVATFRVNSLSEISVTADRVVVNNIPLELRAFLKKSVYAEKWQAENIFAYRLDTDSPIRGQNATDNQRSKLYRALVEVAEDIDANAEIMLNAQDAQVGRQIERLGREIDEKKLEVAKLVQEQRTLRTQYETSVLSK
jgi:hypothetical protein